MTLNEHPKLFTLTKTSSLAHGQPLECDAVLSQRSPKQRAKQTVRITAPAAWDLLAKSQSSGVEPSQVQGRPQSCAIQSCQGVLSEKKLGGVQGTITFEIPVWPNNYSLKENIKHVVYHIILSWYGHFLPVHHERSSHCLGTSSS